MLIKCNVNKSDKSNGVRRTNKELSDTMKKVIRNKIAYFLSRFLQKQNPLNERISAENSRFERENLSGTETIVLN